MDLATTYLGFELPHPLMPGASPLVRSLDTVRKLEDAGAAAIVMRSLFEEQIVQEQLATTDQMDTPTDSFAEALSYMPNPENFVLGSHEYLDKIRSIKAAVAVPVIASLNGTTIGGWLDYAKLIEQAGADAIELNVHRLATDPDETGQSVEKKTLDVAREVKTSVKIPVAVKLSAFYSSIPNLARQLDEIGVDGLVLFNRFYQPDINPEELEVARTLRLSSSDALLMRLRWLAILSGRIRAALIASGGVHTAIDAIKAVMSGAHATQMVSALLKHGPAHLAKVLAEMNEWMEKHEYESLAQMRGNMSLSRCPDPQAYERVNYIHILESWRGA